MIQLPFRGRYFVLTLLLLITFTAHASADNDFSWIKPGENVEAGEIYIKVTPSVAEINVTVYDGIAMTGIPSLDAVADAFGVYKIKKGFHVTEKSKDNRYAADLDRYYKVLFPEEYGPVALIEAYETCNEIEFAEVAVIHKLFYEPSDPRFRGQWHLNHCGFEAAWDVSHGSADIVVGIVDSGIDMNANLENDLTIHEDLEANLWQNLGEDISGDGIINLDDWNGDDDDDNGYPDDFYGWDFTGEDNWPDDPWGERGGHGTHVAGIVSAVTDNETGVASAGFNCRLMIAGCYSPTSDSMVYDGVSGIIYCAENGADVINLSWGSISQQNRRERDAINFALDQGSIIFAACGNANTHDHAGLDMHAYPCAYNGVIGVGATNEDDRKAGFSNYGDYTDIVAPGTTILATYPRNAYRAQSGTSMASPLAAGLGALMLSVLPDLTGDELLERMQQTAVDISLENHDHPGIQYRINADYLLNSTHPKLELDEWSIREWDGDFDGRADPFEHVIIDFTISNRAGFERANNVTFTLENDDPFIAVQRGEGELGNMNGGGRRIVYNNEVPIFYVQWNSPPHYTTFTLTLNSDEDFPTVYELPMTIGQPHYLLVDDDDDADFEKYYRADLDSIELVYDTWTIEDYGLPELEKLSDYSFTVWETGLAQQPLNEEEQILIQSYLESGGSLLISSQYAGNAIGNSDLFVNYFHARHLVDNTADPQLTGVQGSPITENMSLLLIGGGAAGNSQSPSAMEPLDEAQTIFTYNRTGQAGGNYYANETYQVIYLGFALEAASGAGETTTRHAFLDRALEHFYQVGIDEDNPVTVPSEIVLGEPHPNPFNSTTTIGYQLPAGEKVSLYIFDMTGRVVTQLVDELMNTGHHQATWDASGLSTGIYFCRLEVGSSIKTRKLVFVK